MTTCAPLLEGTEKPGFLDHTSECIAHDVKFNETQREFRSVRDEELPSSAGAARTFFIHEEVDRQCLSALEKLFEKLPQDHYLKKTTLPLHLARNEAQVDGAGDSVRQNNSHPSKPQTQEFDGKNSSWIWWEILFEREVVSNSNLHPEFKYPYLVIAVKRRTAANRIILNYAGVENAFDLAWKDPCDDYHWTSHVKSSHILAPRDLNKKCRVTSPGYFRKLEN